MPRTTARTITRTLDRAVRLPSSRNGNPRYLVHFTEGDSARTVVDAACAYDLQNRESFGRPMTVHLDGRGQIAYFEPYQESTP